MKGVLFPKFVRPRPFGRRSRSGLVAATIGFTAVTAVTATGAVVEAADPVAFAVIDCNLPGDQYMLGDGKADPKDWTVEALDADGNVVATLSAVDAPAERNAKVYRTYTVPDGTGYTAVRFKSATTAVEVVPLEEDCASTPVALATGDPGAGLVSVPAERVLETRKSLNLIDGRFDPSGSIPARGVVEFEVLGTAGVPADATAVLLNVAAVQPEGAGHIRAYPCGSATPLTSALNYLEAETRAASVFVKPGANGKVCLYTSTKSHIIADVQGYVAAQSAVTAIKPVRVADTRSGAPVDGPGLLPTQKVDGTVQLDMSKLASFSDVPVGAQGYVLNITTVNATEPGFLTVIPCRLDAGPLGVSSTVNFSPGRATANLAYGVYGDELCLLTYDAVDVIVDVVGYTTSPYGSPELVDYRLRLLDTRVSTGVGEGTNDGRFQGVGRIGAGNEFAIEVIGRAPRVDGGVPTNISAAVLNITAVRPSGAGYISAYECGKKPRTSNLNVRPGPAIANVALVPIGPDGKVCFYTTVETDLVVDFDGFIPSSTTPMRAEDVALTIEYPTHQLEVSGGQAPYTITGDLPSPIELSISDTGEISYKGDASTYTHYVGELTVTDKNGSAVPIEVVIAWYPAAADGQGAIID